MCNQIFLIENFAQRHAIKTSKLYNKDMKLVHVFPVLRSLLVYFKDSKEEKDLKEQ